MLSPEPTVDLCRRIDPRPGWESCIVVAPGPSLTLEAAGACRHVKVMAVCDAWRMVPWADALYASDAVWWQHPDAGARGFAGEKWSSHGTDPRSPNDKVAIARQFGVNLVEGRNGKGFSIDPSCIHYGSNSGFQAVNLAILFGARRIALVGFDMRTVNGRRHFFGDHPRGLRNTTGYEHFIAAFERAATMLPAGVEIVNATPGSALTCFPRIDIDDAFA